MKAVRFHGKQDLRLEEIDEPSPGTGEVKLRNAYNGICGSDLHVYFAPESMFDFSKPNELSGATLPQVFGHEFSGTVVEIGKGVTNVNVGDRVAVWPLHGCGRCAACAMGFDTGCRILACQGINSPGGGMSEFTTVRADKVFVLPESVDLLMGALVEPLATSWHAANRGGVREGQTALITGGGPIGVGLWFALRARGVEAFIVEPVATRRAVLTDLGAQYVFDREQAPEAIAELTGGRGVDVAFEAAGAGSAVRESLAALAPHGVLVIVSLHEKEFGFNPSGAVFAENTIIGSLAYRPSDFREVIEEISKGRYSSKGWVSTVPLSEAQSALEHLHEGRGVKILVTSS